MFYLPLEHCQLLLQTLLTPTRVTPRGAIHAGRDGGDVVSGQGSRQGRRPLQGLRLRHGTRGNIAADGPQTF